MMDTGYRTAGSVVSVLTKLQIRSGKIDRVKQFLFSLNNRQQEMEVLLRECQIHFDCSFVESSHEGDYLYVFKQLSSNEDLVQKVVGSTLPVAAEIVAWAEECFITREDLTPQAVFSRMS